MISISKAFSNICKNWSIPMDVNTHSTHRGSHWRNEIAHRHTHYSQMHSPTPISSSFKPFPAPSPTSLLFFSLPLSSVPPNPRVLISSATGTSLTREVYHLMVDRPRYTARAEQHPHLRLISFYQLGHRSVALVCRLLVRSP